VITLQRAAPTFVVPDVGATLRWYEEKLGFRGHAFPEKEPFVFASLLRDGVELMLLRIEGYERPDVASRRPEGYWDAYIRMQGVHAYYEEVRATVTIRTPLAQQSYGDWEFEVLDPNGYILVFSELLGEVSST
jgi:catechol 2,3-dioxygenase-like lactoylglutathione lyase family enzyme